ncbi:hypothetical protein Bca101_083334 [Brassica carinata]
MTEGLFESSMHPPVQTREMIMEELNVAALQYANVADPKERAARQQRVLQSEMDGSVEETATRILLASNSATALTAAAPVAPILLPMTAMNDVPEEAPAKPVRRRGRPAETNNTRNSRNTVKLSPKVFPRMGSQKRNLAQFQAASPGTSNKGASAQTTSRVRKPRQAPSTAPIINLIPPIAKQPMDFRLRKPDLP